MASTRIVCLPESAQFPTTNFPALGRDGQNRLTLAFDASTDETCYWTGIAPQGLTGTMTAVITYRCASATTGNVVFAVGVEAITDADALDTDASSSFDTVNTSAATAVPGTAGYIDQLSVTLTNQDSVAAGDLIRISLMRDVEPNDSVTGDVQVLAVEIRDAA